MPAAGRNQVAYDDIGYDGITMFIDNSTITYQGPPTLANALGTTLAGRAVTWSADDHVALCADGDPVAGQLREVFDDLFCTVAYKGFVKFSAGQSAVITRGRSIVGALGPSSALGYIRQTVSAGVSYVQAESVEQARGFGRIWTVADTNGFVWVELP